MNKVLIGKGTPLVVEARSKNLNNITSPIISPELAHICESYGVKAMDILTGVIAPDGHRHSEYYFDKVNLNPDFDSSEPTGREFFVAPEDTTIEI